MFQVLHDSNSACHCESNALQITFFIYLMMQFRDLLLHLPRNLMLHEYPKSFQLNVSNMQNLKLNQTFAVHDIYSTTFIHLNFTYCLNVTDILSKLSFSIHSNWASFEVAIIQCYSLTLLHVVQMLFPVQNQHLITL